MLYALIKQGKWTWIVRRCFISWPQYLFVVICFEWRRRAKCRSTAVRVLRGHRVVVRSFCYNVRNCVLMASCGEEGIVELWSTDAFWEEFFIFSKKKSCFENRNTVHRHQRRNKKWFFNPKQLFRNNEIKLCFGADGETFSRPACTFLELVL